MDKPMQEENVMQEALGLRQALREVLEMAREPMPTTEGNLASPQSSLKLDNLKNTISECKGIVADISKGLRLLV